MHSSDVKQTILVVDDDRAIRALVQASLERGGYATLAAASGDEALRIFEKYRPDISLLLTDVIMPGIDGIKLARKAREISPHLPVLVMSASSGGTENREFPFMAKPFIAPELLSRVREALVTK